MLSCLSQFWALPFRLMHFLFSHKGGGPGWSVLLRDGAAAQHSSEISHRFGTSSQLGVTGCPIFFLVLNQGSDSACQRL